MIDLITTVIPNIIKPIIKVLFSPKKLKYTLIGIGAVILVGVTWYLADKYSDMRVKIAEQKVTIETLVKSNEGLAKQLITCISEKENQKKEYEQAVIRRKSLEHDLAKTKEDMKDGMAVFEKECGRIERLMQKKSSLVLRYANRATQQLWDDLSKATNQHD